MRIFDSEQIKHIENTYINQSNISSLDLMERAAQQYVLKLIPFVSKVNKIIILAGPGNNGGDALAIARIIISTLNIRVCVYLYKFGHILSPDCKSNLFKLNSMYNVSITLVDNFYIAPNVNENDIIIDGLFGIGLNRPLEGKYAQLIDFINTLNNKKFSIDVPSGLNVNNGIWNSKIDTNIIEADYTFTFQYPKMSFFYAESYKYVGEWDIIDIGLTEATDVATKIEYVNIDNIICLLKQRGKFDHKGCFGHGLLVAGSKNMAGAALLSAKGAIKSGIGKLTVNSSAENRRIIQVGIPEAIFKSRVSLNRMEINQYSAIAIGPGIGFDKTISEYIKELLQKINKPLIIDADALNIIANNYDFYKLIPSNSIITPHKREFERLFGTVESEYNMLMKAIDAAKRLNIIIVLKGAYSKIVTPNGNVFVNSTGNPAMATAGSGDVLTGMILSLISQGYNNVEATIAGVFLHGLSGDLALKGLCQNTLMASDLVDYVPQAMNECVNFKY